LLDGESIELTRSEVPLAERDLLGSSEITVRCTAEELLERMSEAFDEAKTVVARFGEAWGALIPGVATAQTALDEAQELANGLGEPHRRDLDDAARALARLTTSTSSDPLSTAPGDLDRLSDSLHEIRRDLDATASLRRAFDGRVDDARALLAELETTADEGRAAHEEALVKISVPAARGAPAAHDDLATELDEIVRVARSGAWRDARRRLDAWTSSTEALLEEARHAVRANRAPIEARNQFRALLEAYQVKAQRLGVVEDPELERIFARAHEALYTAPTDLALVAQLVRRYQELISAGGVVQETRR
jgi:ABC-type transporter Mla subunit MlaD